MPTPRDKERAQGEVSLRFSRFLLGLNGIELRLLEISKRPERLRFFQINAGVLTDRVGQFTQRFERSSCIFSPSSTGPNSREPKPVFKVVGEEANE